MMTEDESGAVPFAQRTQQGVALLLLIAYSGYALLAPGQPEASALIFPLLFAVSLLLSRQMPEQRGMRWWVAGHLLLFWPLLYGGAVDVIELWPERYIDPVLERADAVVLGRDQRMPGWSLGGPVEELASLLYVSYYVGVPLAWVRVFRRRGSRAAYRLSVALLVAFTACAVVWLVFPAGGYFRDGSPDVPPWGPFTWVARTVYDLNPHHAAAFPSAHVAVAVTVAWVAIREGASRWWILWAVGIAWAAVYGQYHFLVDILAGFGAGAVGVLWRLGVARREGGDAGG